jgi:hypothetical protein
MSLLEAAMRNHSNPGLVCLSLALAALTTACQGSAGVKVTFANSAAASGQALTLSDGQTPTVFGLKITTMYLVEDRGPDLNNVGDVERIWTNPVCDAELYHCGISPESGPNQVTEYFDLALPTAEVNARLNAQPHDIRPGTYRYLRLSLAGVEKTPEFAIPNLRFGAGDEVGEVRQANNYDVQLDPPLVLADGDSVEVALGYDVRGAYYPASLVSNGNPPDGVDRSDWYCPGNGQGPVRGPCLYFKGFVPSVSRTAGVPAGK